MNSNQNLPDGEWSSQCALQCIGRQSHVQPGPPEQLTGWCDCEATNKQSLNPETAVWRGSQGDHFSQSTDVEVEITHIH
jgi:hypothetical protein